MTKTCFDNVILSATEIQMLTPLINARFSVIPQVYITGVRLYNTAFIRGILAIGEKSNILIPTLGQE